MVAMKNRKPIEQRATILTAWVREADMYPFHRMRQRFFPGHRNFLSAHVTLFHHLRPGVRDRAIGLARERDWPSELNLTPAGELEVGVQGVFQMGKGTAYRLELEPLAQLRRPFSETFRDELTEQDARPWKRPHVTVQNKVDGATAKRLTRHLSSRFRPCTIRVKGLSFYRYDYGPWTLLEHVPF